jgi:hypothetical protein
MTTLPHRPSALRSSLGDGRRRTRRRADPTTSQTGGGIAILCDDCRRSDRAWVTAQRRARGSVALGSDVSSEHAADGSGATAVEVERPATGSPDEPAAAPGSRPAPRQPGRRADGWDVLGILLLASAMLGVHHAATAAIGTPLGHSRVVTVATIVVVAASAVAFAVLVARDRPRPAELAGLVTRVWTDPPGSWAAGLLGGLIATPVLGLYTPLLLGDADSARVVAAVTHVQAHGIDYILKTQDPLLPHVILGPVVAIGGLAAVKLVALLSVQALAGVTCYVTHRITGSMLGGAAAALALLAIPSAVDRAGYVPMYPTMLALGYLGGVCAYVAIARPERSWPAAVAAGVCLALAPEAQAVGVLFLPVPLLLLIFSPTWRAGLASCARIYLVVAVAMIPRLAINLSVNGLERFVSYRTDYWATKGYLREIQSNFWHYTGVDEPLGEYLGLQPWRFTHTLGPWGYVVLGLALLTVIGLALLTVIGRRRARALVFVVAALGFIVLALTVKQIPPFPRYYSPLWPGMAVLVGVGVAGLGRHWGRIARFLAVALIPALAVLAVASLVGTVHDDDRQRAPIDNGPYRLLAGTIDDRKGVIGARPTALVNVTADRPTWGGQFLSEEEFVTYLTWPSDEAVIDVMKRHNIGWVLIHPDRRLETSYHDTWLMPHYGRRARHVDQIAASPNFCPTMNASGFLLYRLGPCDGSP